MFGKLFQRKDTQLFSRGLYASALSMTRKPEFYTLGGVPDTFDGRFDLLLLNIFLILRKAMTLDEYEQTSQNLFDEVFRDMDQVLREMGVGDMGIPKHMRRMMKAFNGRMHAYQVAIDPDSVSNLDLEGLQISDLREALRRNLFGTCDNITDEHLNRMESFVRDNLDKLQINSDGSIEFMNLAGGETK